VVRFILFFEVSNFVESSFDNIYIYIYIQHVHNILFRNTGRFPRPENQFFLTVLGGISTISITHTLFLLYLAL